MYDYKSNFTNALDYGYQKTKMIWWKILLMGILASVYVGIAYSAYIYILSWFGKDSVKQTGEFYLSGGALVVASLIFPVGLMLITILGGSLFTSDTLAMLAVFDKKAKLRRVFRNLGIVFAGNVIGGFIIAAILRGANAFGEDQLKVIEWLITKKVAGVWWEIFFSAMVSNLIVAGTVWSTLATKSATGKILIIFFVIWLFTISGFHHVVANFIVFSFGWLFQDVSYADTFSQASLEADPHYLEELFNVKSLNEIDEKLRFVNKDGAIFYKVKKTLSEFIEIKSQHKLGSSLNWTWRALLVNGIPSLLGNWVSGSILLPTSYWLLIKCKIQKYGTIDSKLIVEKEINSVIKSGEAHSIEEAEMIALQHIDEKRQKEMDNEQSKDSLFEIVKKKIKKLKNKNKK